MRYMWPCIVISKAQWATEGGLMILILTLYNAQYYCHYGMSIALHEYFLLHVLYLHTWHFELLSLSLLTLCSSPSPFWPFVLPPLPFEPLSLLLSPLTYCPSPSSHTSPLLPEFSTDQGGEVKEPAEGIRSTAAVQTTPSGSRRQLTLVLSTSKLTPKLTQLVRGERAGLVYFLTWGLCARAQNSCSTDSSCINHCVHLVGCHVNVNPCCV